VTTSLWGKSQCAQTNNSICAINFGSPILTTACVCSFDPSQNYYIASEIPAVCWEIKHTPSRSATIGTRRYYVYKWRGRYYVYYNRW
jgi:hypothetical protein